MQFVSFLTVPIFVCCKCKCCIFGGTKAFTFVTRNLVSLFIIQMCYQLHISNCNAVNYAGLYLTGVRGV